MIKVKNISKAYYDSKVLNNVSLSVSKGKIFGFLGPNGAGKTTLMKIMVGISQMDKGRVDIEGKNINLAKNRENIGYMPEDPYFYDHLSAKEFMNFVQSLFTKKSSLSIESLLKIVGLGQVGKKKIQEFSKGMKQRLGLAQALVNDPEYLFLDEPLDGLDPIGRKEFKEIILNLKKQGKTIFFNSHILSDVEEICDQIGVIDKGRLIYAGTVKKFKGNKKLEDAFVAAIEQEAK